MESCTAHKRTLKVPPLEQLHTYKKLTCPARMPISKLHVSITFSFSSEISALTPNKEFV
jgi:hypothetical protein